MRHSPFRLGSWMCSALLLLAACQQTDGPALLYEEYQAPGGVEQYVGRGCRPKDMSGSSGWAVAGSAAVDSLPPYTVYYDGGEDAIDVTVTDGDGVVLESRSYTDTFLHSHQVDEMVVELGTGYARWRYWGEQACPP